jgi:hypothetical protein
MGSKARSREQAEFYSMAIPFSVAKEWSKQSLGLTALPSVRVRLSQCATWKLGRQLHAGIAAGGGWVNAASDAPTRRN